MRRFTESPAEILHILADVLTFLSLAMGKTLIRFICIYTRLSCPLCFKMAGKLFRMNPLNLQNSITLRSPFGVISFVAG